MSDNGRFKIEITFTEFRLLERLSGGNYQERTHGKLAPQGHHLSAHVPDTGTHFVVVDRYAGVAVYQRDGTLVTALAPESFLTPEQLQARPGKFACHDEGEWTEETTVEFRDHVAIVNVYTGQRLAVSVDDGHFELLPPLVSPLVMAAGFAALLLLVGLGLRVRRRMGRTTTSDRTVA